MSTTIDEKQRDLWYRIAELMGHKIDVHQKGKRWHASVYYEGSVVVETDYAYDEAYAHEVVQHALPEYLTSVDTALILPIDENMGWNILVFSSGKNHVILALLPFERKLWYGDQDAPLAASMCKAWLAWQESKES